MLDQAPSVAWFHLKRFKSDSNFADKIDGVVAYPLELDLQPYTQKSNVDGDVCVWITFFSRIVLIYIFLSISFI